MGKNEKILIVDDEPDFVEACRMTLEARHYQVMTTSSKSLAQEMMKADPDLIVLGTLAPAGQAFSIYQWVVQHPRYRDIPEPSSLVPRIQSLLEEATRLIRVLVADDHTMVRTGICAILTLQKGLEVVGEAVDGRDAVEKALRLLPHVALMDIVMPGVNGLEATKRTQVYPGLYLPDDILPCLTGIATVTSPSLSAYPSFPCSLVSPPSK